MSSACQVPYASVHARVSELRLEKSIKDMKVLKLGNDELASMCRRLKENRQWNERPSVESDGRFRALGMARCSSVVGHRGAGTNVALYNTSEGNLNPL